MKDISNVVSNLNAEDIKKLEQTGNIELVINEKSIIFEFSDFEIVSQDIEGWLVAHEGALTVALDIVIDKNLKDEGISREFVSKIQTMRKNSGFEVTDRINVFIKHDSNIVDLIDNNVNYIKSETLAEDLKIVINFLNVAKSLSEYLYLVSADISFKFYLYLFLFSRHRKIFHLHHLNLSQFLNPPLKFQILYNLHYYQLHLQY